MVYGLVSLRVGGVPLPVNPEKYRLSGFNPGVDPARFECASNPEAEKVLLLGKHTLQGLSADR